MRISQKRFLALLIVIISCISPALAQPTIQSINTTVPNPTNDPFLNWQVVFDQPVTGVNTANFTTSSTGVAGTIASVTAVPGNQTWNVRVSGISGFGTIGVDLTDPTGIVGTTAPLTQTFTGQFYDVDTISPAVVSITRLDASPTSASSVRFAVTFSEAVTGVVATNFASGGSLTGNMQPPVTTDNLTWTVTMNGISGSGTVRLDLSDTGVIADAAGNWLASDYVGGGEVYDIDQNGPNLICITRLDDSPTSAISLRFQVEFDEAALGVSTTNFAVAGTGVTATIAGAVAEGDGTTWTVTVNAIAGQGQLTLNLVSPTGITDSFGNASTSTGPGCESYDVDRVNPEVVSIALPDPQPIPTGGTATFVVTFSEDISTATLSDFQLVGTASGTITTVTLTSDTVTVIADNIVGPGDLCLRVGVPSSITDLIGNPLINIPVTSACYAVCIAYDPVTILYPQDGETTVTTADNMAWAHTVPGLVYDVYFDGNPLITTTSEVVAIPGPLTPGQHSYRVDIQGSCTSGTTVYFNVLDPANPIFPADGYESCIGPRVFSWEPAEGATTYTLVVDGFVMDITTMTLTDIGYSMWDGLHWWRVDAENEFGIQPGEERSFTVTGFDPVLPSNIQSNGTINQILVTSSTVFVAGSFDAVLNSENKWTTRSNLAAYDQYTGRLYNWHPKVNGSIRALAHYSDHLFLGGDFTAVGETTRSKMAVLKLDCVTTIPLDYGRLGANGTVRTIEVVGRTLIYGGDFTKVGTDIYNFSTFDKQVDSVRLAISDLTTSDSIESVSLAPNASVHDLEYDGGEVYIAGVFSQIGGRPIRAVARTDMPTTKTLRLNPNFDAKVDLYVYSIRKLGPTLFMGGTFNSVMGKQRSNAAAVRVLADDTKPPVLTSWAPKVNSSVLTLAGTRRDSTIFLGGTFTSVNLELQTYMVGVDPVLGYAVSCEFNSDRPIHTIVPYPEEWIVTPFQLFTGGQATITGP